MDVKCLVREQSTAYATCYVLHIVLLAFMIFHWILDLAYLPLVHVYTKPVDDDSSLVSFVGRGQENPRTLRDFPFYLHASEYVAICIATLVFTLVTVYVSGPNHL